MGHRFAILTIALLLALASTAGAELRTGTATDAPYDSVGPSGTDILSATATFDSSSGRLFVNATMRGSISSVRGFISFAASTYTPSNPVPCGFDGSTASLFSRYVGPPALLTIAGYSGSASATLLVNGSVIGVEATNLDLIGRPYTCVQVITSSDTGGAGSTTLFDLLETPLYFNGYGPSAATQPAPTVTPATIAPSAATPSPAPGPSPAPAPVVSAPVTPPASVPRPPTIPATGQGAPAKSRLSPSEKAYRARLSVCAEKSGRAQSRCITRAKQIRALTACSKIKSSKKRASCQRAAKRKYKV